MRKFLPPATLLVSCLMLYTVLIPIRQTLANDEKCHNVTQQLKKDNTMATVPLFDITGTQPAPPQTSYTGGHDMPWGPNGELYNDDGSVSGNAYSPAYSPAGGGGGGATAVDPAVVEQQKRVAQANALKGGITGIINNIKGVYDAIYGDVDAVGKEKAGQVDQRFNQETKSLTDQFASQFPGIGNAYASRGTYDSSYRINAEDAAKTGFNNQLTGIGQDRGNALAEVGKYVAGQQADVNANKGGLDAILAQIQASENPDELQALQNSLDERKRSLEASRAGLRSRDSYLGEVNRIAPTGDRLAGLTANLTNVINSQVPAPLKRAIGRQLIANSGLPPAQQAQAQATLDSQLQAEETPVAV
jgi:hypothetical protein